MREVEWRVLPARRAGKSLLVLGVAFTFAGVVFFWLGPGWALLSLGGVFVALFPFFTPTRYRLDERGVTVKRPFYSWTREWSEFRRMDTDDGGVFLSTFRKSLWIEGFRGTYLMEANAYPEVMAFLKKKVGNAG